MKRILIISTKNSGAVSISAALKTKGYQVITAPEKAVGSGKKQDIPFPDLIISSGRTPAINASIIADLRKNGNMGQIPLILIAGKTGDKNSSAEQNDLNADLVLRRPVDTEELLRAVRHCLGKKNRTRLNVSGDTSVHDSRPHDRNTGEYCGDGVTSHRRTAQKTRSRVPRSFETRPLLSKAASKPVKWILIRGRHTEFLNIDTIMYITAEEDYSNIHTDDKKKYLSGKLLKHWENILPRDRFIRIHRSTIVNLEYVYRIERWFNNTYKVYLKNNSDPLTISRRYVRRVISLFA